MFRHIITLIVCSGLAACSSMERLVDVETKSSPTSVSTYSLDTHKRSVHIFDPVKIDQTAQKLGLQPRLNNLLVLIDEPSLTDSYRGIPKDIYAYEIFRRFNLTVPHLNLAGNAWRVGDSDGTPISADGPYSAVHIQHRLDQGEALPHVGAVDLANAIDRLTEVASRRQGRTGLLLITDWSRVTESVIDSIARFRQVGRSNAGFKVLPAISDWSGAGETFCVFAIGVGNAYSRARLDKVDECGFSASADLIAQPRDMAHFVQRMLFTRPIDTDGDGVFDFEDDCPDTPPGRLITFRGCLRFAENNI